MQYLFGKKEQKYAEMPPKITITPPKEISVAVCESVTAGALINLICSEPGASQYFRGGIVPYNTQSKAKLLNVADKTIEETDHANPFITWYMAIAAINKFDARIGLATTGYSLPTKREEDPETGFCALDITTPKACICLYDALEDIKIIRHFEIPIDPDLQKKVQRATVQTRIAIAAHHMYEDYTKQLSKLQASKSLI